jgi:hypothetical protein
VWVVIKKAGGFFDSFGDASTFLDDSIVDILHKGMVPIANAWAAEVSDGERDKVGNFARNIDAFKDASGLVYDKRFSRFFTEEDLFTVYGWMTHATAEECEELKWFIDQLTEKMHERQWKLIPPCCGLRDWVKNKNRPDFNLLENFKEQWEQMKGEVQKDTWAGYTELKEMRDGNEPRDAFQELQEFQDRSMNPMAAKKKEPKRASAAGSENFYKVRHAAPHACRVDLRSSISDKPLMSESFPCGHSMFPY